jgi:hypothetical protein
MIRSTYHATVVYRRYTTVNIGCIAAAGGGGAVVVAAAAAGGAVVVAAAGAGAAATSLFNVNADQQFDQTSIATTDSN